MERLGPRRRRTWPAGLSGVGNSRHERRLEHCPGAGQQLHEALRARAEPYMEDVGIVGNVGERDDLEVRSRLLRNSISVQVPERKLGVIECLRDTESCSTQNA